VLLVNLLAALNFANVFLNKKTLKRKKTVSTSMSPTWTWSEGGRTFGTPSVGRELGETGERGDGRCEAPRVAASE